MKMNKKLIGLIVGVFVIATALFAYGPGWGRNHMRGDYDYQDGPMSERFYNNNSELIEKHQEKTEQLYDKLEDNQEEIADLVQKKNPNWDKVSDLMDEQHELKIDLMEIRKQSRMELLKNTDYEDRQQLMGYGNEYGHHRGTFGLFGNCAGGNYGPGRGQGGYHHNNNYRDGYHHNNYNNNNRRNRGGRHMMGR